MLLKDSRYLGTRRFDPDPTGTVRCKGTTSRAIGPATGVLEHVVREGDRLDLLARHYYGDDRLWWRILDANPDLLNGAWLSLPESVGETILIPRAKE
ncbi:MAG: tail protein X [Verrucomicrobiae bacterium]|nr:tail protein X [Verrucomicrobiae bacterium]MCP5524230.1 tail protein X [Verrucomicrobiales bacterium]